MNACLLSATILAALLTVGQAQDSFTIEWSSIDGGGGPLAGDGEFTLAGSSVGQATAGAPGGGPPGEFSVAGGYWTFEFEPSLPDLNLTMQLDGGIVTLTWDPGGPPVVLESSADLNLWTPVEPQPAAPFFEEPEGTRQYYRLSRP